MDDATRANGAVGFTAFRDMDGRRLLCPAHSIRLTRLPEPEMLEDVYRIASEPEVARYMEWDRHRSPDDTRSFFEHCATEWATGIGYHFAVQRLEAPEVIGVGSVSKYQAERSSDGNVAEIATWLAPSAWGGGMNKAVKHILFELAFTHLGQTKLIMRVADENINSIRSHERRLHTRREAPLRKALLIDGKWRDAERFSLGARDYSSRYGPLDLTIVT